jgi:RNA polymerase sigma factor for flagellar operon FliA
MIHHLNEPSQEEFAVLASVIHAVARSRRLSAADTQDFTQTVQLRLIRRNYDIFHRFAGRSSLRTYLTVVVSRMLLDWFDSTYGKWRPSAAAARLGPHACSLDRLVNRDGYTLGEAIEKVSTTPDAPSAAALRSIAVRIPTRCPRRLVSAEILERMPIEPKDSLEQAEELRTRRHVRDALTRALGELAPEDRKLIDLRYRQKISVQALAVKLGLNPKALYRRFERALRCLRKSLVAAGVQGPQAIDPRRFSLE